MDRSGRAQAFAARVKSNSAALAPLILRADASAELGTGHVMRCLALAQAWQEEGGTAVMACAQLPPTLMQRLHGEGVPVRPIAARAGSAQDAEATASLAEELEAPVVVDGYRFSYGFQDVVRKDARALLVVDDFCQIGGYSANQLLDQNLGVGEDLYLATGYDGSLLLGPRYALLRREFRIKAALRRPPGGRANHLLVTLGGSDPGSVTPAVLKLLAGLNRLPAKVTVLIGPAAQASEEILATAAHLPTAIRVISAADDVASLMRDVDVAVSAAGSTVWELALFAIPSLLVVTAANQERAARQLSEQEMALVCNWDDDQRMEAMADSLSRLLSDAHLRAALANRLEGVVDGRGALRVVRALRGRQGEEQ